MVDNADYAHYMNKQIKELETLNNTLKSITYLMAVNTLDKISYNTTIKGNVENIMNRMR